MDLRSLDYFSAVAGLLSFSKAAESRYVSQSALSRAIADLEMELGVQLLERSSRFVKLTPAGADFLQEAKEILNRTYRLENAARAGMLGKGEEYTQARTLSLGITGEACSNVRLRSAISETIIRLLKTYPLTTVHFEEYTAETVMKGLHGGEVDICFPLVHDSADMDEECNYYSLLNDEMVILFNREEEKPATREGIARMLASHPLNMMENDTHGLPRIMALVNSLGATPNIVFHKGKDVLTILTEIGYGISIGPRSLFDSLASPSLDYIDGLGPEAQHYYCAAWEKSNVNNTIQIFLEMLSQTLETYGGTPDLPAAPAGGSAP